MQGGRSDGPSSAAAVQDLVSMRNALEIIGRQLQHMFNRRTRRELLALDGASLAGPALIGFF
jgi:hypothetical protein